MSGKENKPAAAMTEQEQFDAIDAYEGNTMIAFSGKAIAMRYVAHRSARGMKGVVVICEDTRTQSGLCVMWRDPVEPDKLAKREANCRWLLEEILAGRQPGPVAGELNELWSGGFPGANQ